MKIVFKQFANYKKELARLMIAMIGMVCTIMFWPKLMAKNGLYAKLYNSQFAENNG